MSVDNLDRGCTPDKIAAPAGESVPDSALEGNPLSFSDRIAACSDYDPGLYRPFRVDGIEVGRVRHDYADALSPHAHVFHVSADEVRLADGLKGFHQRTEAIDGVLRILAERGDFGGWRDEQYPVAAWPSVDPLFTMERAAVPLFGVMGYGVHMNGTVTEGGTIRMWIARRSMDKATGPGKLDQLVAGGLPAGISPLDNLIKECAEEAGIEAGLAARARAMGEVSYQTGRAEGLWREVLYIYDLELAADFRPVNADGEVDDFYLWPMERVIECVRDSDDFEFDCALVVIDFLVRHGFIGPNHPEYQIIVNGLRL